jgi:hypothetical protein
MSRNLSASDSDHPGAGDPLTSAAALALGGGRLAIGIGLFAAPQLTLRSLGFKEVSEQMISVARIAGGRDFLMGAETIAALASGDRSRLRRAHLMNAGADTGDAAAFALAHGQGGEMRSVALRGLPLAAFAALGGFLAAARG